MTKTWYSESEPPLRRYGARGPPYQISSERHRYHPESLRHSTRSYGLPIQDSQRHDNDQDSEREAKESRRRIPVACGRCRKRKIRCSGPQGDDSCVNCKNAGNSDCQFNRVSSEEMTFNSSVEFGYNTELARAVHCRGGSQANSYRPQTPSYNYGPVPMPANLSISYRTHPNSDYQYDAKSSCSLPSFSTDYNEDSLDYSLPGSTYPLYGPETVGGLSNYSSYGTNRVFIPGPQTARGSLGGIYFGSDAAAYGPSQTHYNGQAYGLRSSVSSEPNLFSFSDMTSSLPITTPSPITSHTRILPIPSRRNNSVLAPLHRSADDLSYGGSTVNSVGGHTLAAGQLMTGGHSNSLTYLPQSSNHDPAEGYNCHSLAGSLSHSQSDLYSGTDNWSPTTLTTDPALRSHSSSADLFYSHCSDTSRRASQSGQSNISGTLTNGHVYQASPHQDKTIVPRSNSMSSMDMSRGAARHRPSSGNLRAAL